jgi:GntR family transcriptional regulator, transcriptional repressor for pyruvate dehydrogenase complex
MNRIRPVRRLGDDLYRSLAAMIVSDDLPEGARLPPEMDLALQYGVSRPTVRETLARLRDEGLIASRRGSGSYVQRRAMGFTETKVGSAPLQPSFREIDSVEQIKNCYEFRKAVEGEAAALAADAHSEALLAEIRKAVAGLDRAVAERAVGADADFQFHLALAAASRNSWFVAALQAMRRQIETTIDIARKLSLNKPQSHLDAVQSEHVAIYDAIRRRDPAGAREAMRSHLTNTCDRIFRGPSL